MATNDFPAEIKALRTTLESIEAVSDPTALEAKIAELSEQASAPNLWDDPEEGQKVTSALSAAQAELSRVEKLAARIDDVETLVELGQEMEDADSLTEAEEEVEKIRKDLAALEVRTLLNGEYDSREAVVTIRAGAGGVDAADFAEMLMRMYLRWAEKKGYAYEMLDEQAGDEAGIRGVTFTVSGFR